MNHPLPQKLLALKDILLLWIYAVSMKNNYSMAICVDFFNVETLQILYLDRLLVIFAVKNKQSCLD
jgi:hypothetical protein